MLDQVSLQLLCVEAWCYVVQLGSGFLHWACRSCVQLGCSVVRLGLVLWPCLEVGRCRVVHLGLCCLLGCFGGWLGALLCCVVVQLGLWSVWVYLVWLMVLEGYIYGFHGQTRT